MCHLTGLKRLPISDQLVALALSFTDFSRPYFSKDRAVVMVVVRLSVRL